MLALVSRLGSDRLGPAGAFVRRWVPVLLSALPFWESGQSAYRTLTVAVGVAAAAALFLPPLLLPVAAALAVRALAVPRQLGLWFSAIFPVYLVVLWCLSGFNAGSPLAWWSLWQTWFANQPISLWIPICTGVALLAWLGPTRAGGERIDLSFSRFRWTHFAGFPVLCVVLTWLLGCYVESAGVAVRSGSLLGIVVVMVFVGRLINKVSGALRSDAKRLAVTEVQREEPSAPAANRVASLVQPSPSVEPVDDFAMAGSEEMVMPSIPLGVRDGGAFERETEAADAGRETYPQKGDLLASGETLSAASWQVLDEGGDPDDEDDIYGLMRPTYQKVAAEVQSLNASRLVIPIVIEPPVPSLPVEPGLPVEADLPIEVLETMGPHEDLDDDISESGLLDVVTPVPLPSVEATPAPVAMAITITAEPVPEVASLPEAMHVTLGDSEPLMMEEFSDPAGTGFEAAVPAPVTLPSASSAAPVSAGIAAPVIRPPAVMARADRTEPPSEIAASQPDRRATFPVGTLSAAPSKLPDAPPIEGASSPALDIKNPAKTELKQDAEPVSMLSNADALTQKRLRSVCIRMISAYTRILSEGGGDADIARLVAPHMTPAHEALLDQLGGADLREALERSRSGSTAGTEVIAPQPETVPPEALAPPVVEASDVQATEVAAEVDVPREGGVATIVEAPHLDDASGDALVVSAEAEDVAAEAAPAPDFGPDRASVVGEPVQEDREAGPEFDMDALSIRVPEEGAAPEPVAASTEGGPEISPGEPTAHEVEMADPVPAVPSPEVMPPSAGTPVPAIRSAVEPARLGMAAELAPSVPSAPVAGGPASVAVAAPPMPRIGAVEGVADRGSSGPSASELLRTAVTSAPVKPDPARSPLNPAPDSPMQPVFEIDEVVVRPVEEPLVKTPVAPAPVAEEETMPSEDARAMAVLEEWLATPPVAEVELERLLGELGRGLPDDMEIEFLARRLAEYEPSPNSFRSLDGHLASLLMRRTEQTYSRDDVAMAKGLLCLISSHVFDRWRFASRDQMLARLAFFLCDPFTRRLVARVDNWLKEGFATQESVRLARGYIGILENFYAAYPEKVGQQRELTAALDMAEYNFAHPTGATAELVHEGLSSIGSRDVTAATDLARARLLAGSLPGAAQDGLNQFMKLAGVIDEIDVVIKRESIKHKAPTENHPLHSALMELEYRAVGLINDLRSHLVRREEMFERIPSILRGRNADAAHLFERLRANADAISEAVVESRDRQAAAEHSVREIRALRDEVAQREDAMAEMRKELSQRVVMDALVASAGIIADQERRFELVERKGPVRLRAVAEAGIEYAIVFMHGLDAKWTVMSGSRLEMQGARGETVQSLDLLALRETIRNTHLFGDAKQVRLRVVLEAGDLTGGRTDFVFARSEAIADPSRLLDESDFDTL